MIVTIWLLAKPGEERMFASTRVPNPDWLKIQKAKGYRLFEINAQLPPEFDCADGRIETPFVASEVKLGIFGD